MVKKKNKKKYLFYILAFFIILLTYIGCGNVYVYHCEDARFTFSVLEREDASVLIFEDSDSIFITPARDGEYVGIEFYLLDSINTIFINPHEFQQPTYKIASHKYQIQYLLLSPDSIKVDYSPLGNKYWAFYGNCKERGEGFTFEYRRSNSDFNYPTLKASFLEGRGSLIKY